MQEVLKKTGKLVPVDDTKIIKMAKEAVEGLDLNYQELLDDARIVFYNGISTTDIQKTLIKTAVNKIAIDQPNWTFVASRLFLYDMYHNFGKTLGTEKGSPYPSIKAYLDHGMKNGRIIPNLDSKYNLNALDSAIKPERDLQFTYLGIKTFYDRYVLRDLNGEPFELPQYLFMGVAMFVAQNETVPTSDMNIDKNLDIDSSEYLKAVRTQWAIKFYNMLSSFEVMAGTPTISNGRTPRSQLSSCFINAAPDNIEGIFDLFKEQALLSKFGGGIGTDWTLIRGMGSSIDDHKGAAGGSIPFLKIDNDVAIAVDQLGTRKGAFAVYLEPWHLDIYDFLELKKTSGEDRKRAHDLFPAIFLNDLFLERARDDEEWSLFSSDDVPGLKEAYGEDFYKLYMSYEKDTSIPRHTVNAKNLWKVILKEYFETGSPFLSFKDTANKANPNKHAGVIRSSNLCQEIFQNTSPNKYKIKIEFTDNSELILDEYDLVTTDDGVVKKASKIAMTDVIDGKQVYFIGKETEDGETAVCNLASVNLSKVNTKSDFERVVPIAIRFLDAIVDLNFYPVKKAKDTNLKSRAIGLGIMGEAHMLAKHKIHFGSQEHFEKIDEIMDNFSFEVIKASSDLAKEKGSYPLFEGSDWQKGIFPMDHANQATLDLTDRVSSNDWDGLKEKVAKDGMRNGYLMAIAPTSSISILTGTSQAIEPIFARYWKEENLSGEIPVCAPDLSPDTWVYYETAYNIDQHLLIKAGSIRQKWLDQGQSLNIFLTLDIVSGKLLNSIYMTAWKYALKSTYYLRSKSPENNLNEDAHVEDRSMECVGCQ